MFSDYVHSLWDLWLPLELSMTRKFANCVMEQYTAAVKSSTLDNTAKALDSLHNTFKKDPRLQTILRAPALTTDDKKALVTELQRTIGSPNDTVKNFLNTVAANNRLGVLEGVCEKFQELMSAVRGEVEMTVTSAAVG
jgi:F-type H+-transporting ATPase subunit O